MRMAILSSACLVLLLCFAAQAPAQCASLGTPAENSCHLGSPPSPTLTCAGTPNVGNAGFSVVGSVPCLEFGAILLLGPCAAPPVPITGPFGTDAFCQAAPFATCVLWVDPSALVVIPGVPVSTGTAYAVPIPNLPSLVGQTACAQGVSLCVLFVGSCAALTPGLSITILP